MRKIGKSHNIQLRQHQFELLVGLFEKSTSKKEIVALLETLMTTSERESIAQRASILYRIHKGEKYFDLICAYGVAPSTISKAVDLYHKHGDHNHDFNLVLDRYKEPKQIYKLTPDFPGIRNPKSNKPRTSLGHILKNIQP